MTPITPTYRYVRADDLDRLPDKAMLKLVVCSEAERRSRDSPVSAPLDTAVTVPVLDIQDSISCTSHEDTQDVVLPTPGKTDTP